METDFQNPGREHSLGSIVAGAAFIILAINGFASLPRRKKTVSDIEKETRRLAKEQKKAVKEEAREAKQRLEQAKANSEAALRNEEAARKAVEETQQKEARASSPVAESENSGEKEEKKTIEETK